ncbi:glycosyltransferase family 10 domain-containing protein [Bosea sp. MMO-172]|uniref:glycosyltransferase family 10 domain-containing protein n=1 Tax=Bosea sp. MMO-172 TaxID=3127885 RepID=UPI00301960D3
MLRVKFLSRHDDPWLRQFPNRDGLFDGVQFLFDAATQDYDFLVVLDVMPSWCPYQTQVPRQRRMLVATEPATVKHYGPAPYLDQFGAILTTDAQTSHPHVILSQVGLPWHVGSFEETGRRTDHAYDLRFFEQFEPQKTKLVSVVSSNKSFTADHRERLDFFHRLKTYFGSEMDYYGRGINTFVDKMEVLAPYRYHIAIENFSGPYYWTEKLSDPFLTMTFPIYHGCTNVSDYFPAEALVSIDIRDPEAAVRTIKRVIESDLAERSRAALAEARRRVLYEHNLFAMLARLARQIAGAGPIVMLDQKEEIHAAERFGALKQRLWLDAQVIAEQHPALHRLEQRAKRFLRRSSGP